MAILVYGGIDHTVWCSWWQHCAGWSLAGHVCRNISWPDLHLTASKVWLITLIMNRIIRHVMTSNRENSIFSPNPSTLWPDCARLRSQRFWEKVSKPLQLMIEKTRPDLLVLFPTFNDFLVSGKSKILKFVNYMTLLFCNCDFTVVPASIYDRKPTSRSFENIHDLSITRNLYSRWNGKIR